MIEKIKIYYKTWLLIRNQILMACIIVLLFFYRSFPTTYFEFLNNPPGSWLVYACWGVLVCVFISKIPDFLRSVVGVPAIEFDGKTLLVRGWDNRSFEVGPSHPISFTVDDRRGRLSISSPGKKSAHIYLSQIDGPKSLTNLLESLARSE